MVNIFISIALFIALLIGLIWLQVYLSEKENKYLGWILPSISFIFSVLAFLGVILFIAAPEKTDTSSKILQVLVPSLWILLYYNIPTIIFIIIYRICKNKIKKNKELEKMNIQDL